LESRYTLPKNDQEQLMPGRVLVIGRKEQLPDSLKGFHPLPAVSCLYRMRASEI
jgi:hypothetical protein